MERLVAMGDDWVHENLVFLCHFSLLGGKPSTDRKVSETTID
jgi:hypothetical protein